jgi:hypothetical protein
VNIHESQRAYVAAKIADLPKGAHPPIGGSAPTQADAATMLNVSERSDNAESALSVNWWQANVSAGWGKGRSKDKNADSAYLLTIKQTERILHFDQRPAIRAAKQNATGVAISSFRCTKPRTTPRAVQTMSGPKAPVSRSTASLSFPVRAPSSAFIGGAAFLSQVIHG